MDPSRHPHRVFDHIVYILQVDSNHSFSLFLNLDDLGSNHNPMLKDFLNVYWLHSTELRAEALRSVLVDIGGSPNKVCNFSSYIRRNFVKIFIHCFFYLLKRTNRLFPFDNPAIFIYKILPTNKTFS